MSPIFVKTFKGYEDKTAALDTEINAWLQTNAATVELVGLQTAMAHEPGGRAGSGDLVYTLLYRAKAPVP